MERNESYTFDLSQNINEVLLQLLRKTIENFINLATNVTKKYR
jgi:hypothetical protein